MKTKPINEIKEFAKVIAEPLNLRVEEVEIKSGNNPSLTFFIDKDGGVDLNACEVFSRAIDAPLDEFDPTFGQPYTLNVSSLGADRAFKTDKDFSDSVGGEVEVKLYASIKGKKYYEGILVDFDDTVVHLKVDEKDTFTIERKAISKINKAIKFD